MEWIVDHLTDVLRWHLANPGRGVDPDAPEVMPAAARVWGMYLALSASRVTGFTIGAISLADIDAYGRLHRTPVRPFEVDIIRALDQTYLEIVNTRQSTTGKEQPGQVASRPMSPELFDAIFK